MLGLLTKIGSQEKLGTAPRSGLERDTGPVAVNTGPALYFATEFNL